MIFLTTTGNAKPSGRSRRDPLRRRHNFRSTNFNEGGTADSLSDARGRRLVRGGMA